MEIPLGCYLLNNPRLKLKPTLQFVNKFTFKVVLVLPIHKNEFTYFSEGGIQCTLETELIHKYNRHVS
jgi:hypothetical protein